MKTRHVTCYAATELDGRAPDEICYLPEGSHNICPLVDQKPQRLVVHVSPENGETIAATLQASLSDRKSKNVRPWFDFEHKNGASSALPVAFRYQSGVGVMCSLEWTSSGRAAVEGRDYSYFSPSFLIDDDGVPSGLPVAGPLGALCNEPAFREIPRIAATDASQSEIKHTTTMSKLIFAALSINPEDANAESLAVKAVGDMQAGEASNAEKIATLESTIADLTAQCEALKAEAGASSAKVAEVSAMRAKSIVAAAVADGRLLAKDEKTQGFYTRLITAGDAGAEEALLAMPRANAGLTTPLTTPAATANPAVFKSLQACLAEELEASRK